MTYGWRTVDFHPAGPGWLAVYTDDPPGRTFTYAVAGWLTQEEITKKWLGDPGEPTGARRVVAAVLDGDELTPAAAASNFWCVLGPGDPQPTSDEEAAERARQRRVDRRRRGVRDPHRHPDFWLP